MWIYFVKGEVLVGYCYRSSTKVLLWVVISKEVISKEDGEIKEATKEDGVVISKEEHFRIKYVRLIDKI